KTIVALACLENGLDPKAMYEVQPHPTLAGKGVIYVGRRRITDLASPGLKDLKLALMESSNAYFITNGIHVAGIEKIVQLGQQLRLGDSMGPSSRQETAGLVPSPKRIRSNWSDGDTANLCIGQGDISV